MCASRRSSPLLSLTDILLPNAAQGGQAFLVDRHFNMVHVPQLYFPRREGPVGDGARPHEGTLLDGEVVRTADGKSVKYLIFDLTNINGASVVKRPLYRRLQYAHDDVIRPREMDAQHDYSKEPFTVELKPFFEVWQCDYILKELVPVQTHENDGIILTPVTKPYWPGTFDGLLKWKPSSLNTVDFMVQMRYRQRVPRIMLCVSDRLASIDYEWLTLPPEQEHMANDPDLNNTVVECKFDPDLVTYHPRPEGNSYSEDFETRKGGWRILKVRDDKPLPNDLRVVGKVKQSIKDNIEEEEFLKMMLAQKPAGMVRKRARE